MIGYETVGSGPRLVVVMNDWLGDTSSWDGARPYLDGEAFTWIFADLRGYGRSRELSGEHTVEEAAGDVVAMARAAQWKRFAIVGHSMSSLVALHLGQHSELVDRVIVLTPAPPRGFGVDDARLAAMRALAQGNATEQLAWLRSRSGDELSEGWLRLKVARWRASAAPDVVAAYASMFAQRGLPHPEAPVKKPVLAVTGEKDVDVMRTAQVTGLLSAICSDLVVVPLADCGHYPMQEAPPRLVAVVERFLRQEP